MKYGLEKEFFILKNQEIQIVPINSTLPYDECGYLVEARGKPSTNIVDAIYLLKSEIYKIERLTKELGFELDDSPIKTLTRDFKRNVRRNYTKGFLKFENMYDFKDNRHKQNEATAAVHISFTNPIKIEEKDGSKYTINSFFDFIKYVKAFDKAFKEEIKNAKRNPGFYELKDDGRIEYRSLPANIDLFKIIEVINSIK